MKKIFKKLIKVLAIGAILAVAAFSLMGGSCNGNSGGGGSRPPSNPPGQSQCC